MVATGVGICPLPEFIIEQPDIHKRPIVKPAFSRSIKFAYVPKREHEYFILSLLDETKGNLWPLAIDS